MPPRTARVLIFCIALSLVGCGSVPGEIPPSPNSSETPASVAPQARVSITCDDLESLAVDAMQVEADAVEASLRELTEAAQVRQIPGDLVRLQAGVLGCAWEETTPDRSGAWFGVSILPDAQSDFAAQPAPSYPEDWEPGALGTGSLLLCPDESVNRCEVSFLVHNYWVLASLRLSHEPDNDSSLRRQLVLTAADGIGDLLGTAGPPRPPFTPLADTLAVWSDCDELEGALGLAFDSPGLELSNVAVGDQLVGDIFNDATGSQAGYASCTGNPDGDVVYAAVGILPGGGWAFDDDWLAGGPNLGAESSSVAVDGADVAVLFDHEEGLDDPDQIWSIAARVDGSMVYVQLYFEDEATGDRPNKIVAVTEQLVDALTAPS